MLSAVRQRRTMRTLALIALALVTAGCWTPGPGQLDPTRYPWDQPKRLALAPPKADYCRLSLEVPSDTRIVARGQVPPFEQVPPQGANVVHLACTVEPNTR